MTAPPPYAAQVCYRHADRPAGVRCVRCDHPICSECMIPAPVGFQCPECVREANRSARRPVTAYGGGLTGGPVVTWALIAINVAVFVVTSVSSGRVTLFSGGQTRIYDDFALVPPAVAHGDIWRLLTAAFLHYGILHIGFNMYALFIIGPVVERALGRWRYLAVYLLAGIGGSIFTVAFAAPASQSAGASGAIFGLFGAVYVLQRRVGQRTQTILPTIIINLVFTFTIPNISWEGHIGGLIVGSALTAALVATAQQAGGRLRRHVGVVAGAAVVLAAAGFASVQRADSECANPSNRSTAAYCEFYDPGSVHPGGGNSAGGLHVVPSGKPRTSGGHHA
jgi:membrane associated rhomboid family serine protease